MAREDGAVSLLITGDEESEAVNGTVKLLAWAVEQGERFDACLVGEPTCPERLGDTMKIGRRGSVTCRLTVRGRQGHTAYPQRADNAAHRLIAVLGHLIAAPLDQGTDWFEPSNLQVTSIDIGNPAANVIPGEATARFNIRFNDRHNRDSLDAWLRGQIAPLAPEFELSVLGNAEAFVTAPGRAERAAGRQHRGRDRACGRRSSTSGGTSDARFFPPYCPVIEFGLVGTTMHQADEHVAVADIEGLTRIYQRFVRSVPRRLMPTWPEIVRSVQAAWLLARGDKRGARPVRPQRRRLLEVLRRRPGRGPGLCPGPARPVPLHRLARERLGHGPGRAGVVRRRLARLPAGRHPAHPPPRASAPATCP